MQFLRRLVQVTGLATGMVFVALLISFQSAQAQSGSGAILINARACSEAAKAEVVVQTAAAEPQEVTKGLSGAPLSVPPGTYDIEITCTDLVDHPTQSLRGVEIAAGATVEREVNFLCGTTVLHVKLGGKVLNQEFSLKTTKGVPLPGKARSGEPFKASPGQYEAEILVGARGRQKLSHSITGIQVYDGAKRNIPVNL